MPFEKRKYQDILDGFLAQIMIDAVDLILFQNLADLAIQCLGRFQIAAERLLDNDAPPVRIVLTGQALFAQLADDLREELRQRGEIIEHVARKCDGAPSSSAILSFSLTKSAAFLKSPVM